MLARYPGITIVGGLAMAFAIWVGAGTFELVSQLVRPSLPFARGDRIVGIRTWDAAVNRAEARVAHDFAEWRREVKTIEHLGAFRLLKRKKRPFIQVVLGITVGALLVVGLEMLGSSGRFPFKHVGFIVLYSVFMMSVCLLACIIPTRRALRVQLTDALRAE